MNIKVRLLIIVSVLINVSACSVIKSYFPDKEKDYQFTTEIPALILPPDLAANSLAKVPAAVVAPVAEAAEVPPATHQVETLPDVDRKLIQAELVDAEQGTKRIHISAPGTMAWRMVGKALSRKALEVTDRNQENTLFHVRYDQNKQQVEDDSLLGEVAFLFKGFVSGEQEYILKLIENNAQTDVIILNKDEKPVADEASLSLLTLIYDTIKADLTANNKKEKD
jgi:outer membrane protein assembly factor BamC